MSIALIAVMFAVATWTSTRRLAGLEAAGPAVVAGCAAQVLTATVVTCLLGAPLTLPSGVNR